MQYGRDTHIGARVRLGAVSLTRMGGLKTRERLPDVDILAFQESDEIYTSSKRR